MSAIPAFEVGVWNAWIPTTLLFLFIMLSGLLPKDIGKRITPTKEDNKTRRVMLIVFFIMIIYSIFLPLKLGTVWFYAGLAIYIIGFIISSAALFSIAATKSGEPFTTGMYRYSRHPIALGTLLPFIGAGIAAASWLFLLLSAILMAISHFLAMNEESATTKKFGDAYKEYIARTPRWLGIPKSQPVAKGKRGVTMNTQETKLPQPMLPRGLAGCIIAWMMPLGHNSIYKRVSKVLNLQPEDDLAEVACGGGHFLKKYASHVRSIAGLDLSDVQVKMANRKLRSRIATGTAEIILGDASQLPWEDNRFSVVTTMGSIMGFPKPLESLKEMHRVLRSGGRAVVSIENNAEDGKDYSKYAKEWGMWVWTKEEVLTIMKEAGFSEVSVIYEKGLGMPKMMIVRGLKQ